MLCVNVEFWGKNFVLGCMINELWECRIGWWIVGGGWWKIMGGWWYIIVGWWIIIGGWW